MKDNPDGPQDIVIGGRKDKWPYETISYEQIVEKWNEYDPSRQIQGTPGISWENNYAGDIKDFKGEAGILYPGESIHVRDGLVITIDPSHLS